MSSTFSCSRPVGVLTTNLKTISHSSVACCVLILKVKVALQKALKAQKRSRYIDLSFVQPRRWVRVGGQIHNPAVLTPVKETPCPLYRGFDGPQGQYGWLQNIPRSTGTQSPDRPARRKSLYRLSCFGKRVKCTTDNNKHNSN
jgi:hypothetical protein